MALCRVGAYDVGEGINSERFRHARRRLARPCHPSEWGTTWRLEESL